MWRFSLLLLVVIGCAVFAGCGKTETKPATPSVEQKREMQKTMQDVENEERAARR